MRLIDADALIPMMKYVTIDNEIGVFPIKIGFDAIKRVIDDAPTIDAVSKGVVEQFRWERDVAMAQLEEYGIPFGTDKDEDMVRVVRCKDCRHRYEEGDCTHYYWCRLHDRPVDDADYCAWGEESEVEECRQITEK